MDRYLGMKFRQALRDYYSQDRPVQLDMAVRPQKMGYPCTFGILDLYTYLLCIYTCIYIYIYVYIYICMYIYIYMYIYYIYLLCIYTHTHTFALPGAMPRSSSVAQPSFGCPRMVSARKLPFINAENRET